MPGAKGKSGGRRNEAAARNGRAVGPKPRGVRADIGVDAMSQLGVLAAAEGVTAEALATRWLGERVAAEHAAYLRERGIAPAEWGGGVL